jgi:hypothetical protein
MKGGDLRSLKKIERRDANQLKDVKGEQEK